MRDRRKGGEEEEREREGKEGEKDRKELDAGHLSLFYASSQPYKNGMIDRKCDEPFLPLFSLHSPSLASQPS